jgi:hypothetical protein
MRPLHIFYLGWGCMTFPIFIEAGFMMALAFTGFGLIMAAAAKWFDEYG